MGRPWFVTRYNLNSMKNGEVDGETEEYVREIDWLFTFYLSFTHVGSLIGIYLILTGHVSLFNIGIILLSGYLSGLAVTAGAHRLWAHKCYKASWPIRLLLTLLYVGSGQRSLYRWIMDHRIHHKFTDTPADPHDSTRGFFFSHIGWLLISPHPKYVAQVKRSSEFMKDIEADEIIMWQQRHYLELMALLVFVIPFFFGYCVMGDTVSVSFWCHCLLRYAMILNFTWLVNSAAHIWGYKPYDKNISPAENFIVSFLALGEGHHNYHHTFPYDYRTSEVGKFNLSTHIIDLWAICGWAWDLKSVTPAMVLRRRKRTGDLVHCEENIWGYGDKDMKPEDLDDLNRLKTDVNNLNQNLGANKESLDSLSSYPNGSEGVSHKIL